MCGDSIPGEALADSCGLERMDAALASALYATLKTGPLRTRVTQQMDQAIQAGHQLTGRQVFHMSQSYCAVKVMGCTFA